jgi:hypothetical protein
MTIAFLPGPTQSHTINVNVALVGTTPRIGFFDNNGMLLDTAFTTYVTDASTNNVDCTLQLALQVPNMQLFVEAKPHSPLTLWTPNKDNTVVYQTQAIGPTSEPYGVTSDFNVIVAETWGSPNAIWHDPTWPLGRVGSGGPKAVSVPQDTANYFYVTSLGTSSAPKQLQLYVNVTQAEDGTPYAWLSNADGIMAGNILVLYPPVGSSSQDTAYWQLVINRGTVPSGTTVLLQNGTTTMPLPTNINLYYALSGTGISGSFSIIISGVSGPPTTINYYGQTTTPGPLWPSS